MEKNHSKRQAWADLLIRHEELVKSFTSQCQGDVDFLRYLYEREAPSWKDPQKDFKRASRAAVKKLEYALTIPDKRADARRRLLRIWYGRPLKWAERWMWFFALVPYMTFKRDAPNWRWLASWVYVLEGTSLDEETLRQWWTKSLETVSTGAVTMEARSTKAKAISTSRGVVRRLVDWQFITASLAYVRFLRIKRPAAQRGDITEVLTMEHLLRTPEEARFADRGVLRAFDFLGRKPVTQKSLQDYYDCMPREMKLRRVPSGYSEVVNKTALE
ncbi:MAG: hypothetical protein M0D55_08040 [Elusimicrobiota bacterium]|nr:MAG: hypothetical protein M0D55_08040 [Elusimicrobiota bacterium]